MDQCFKPENIQGHVGRGGSELLGVSMAIPRSIFLTDLHYKWGKSPERNTNGIQQTLPSNNKIHPIQPYTGNAPHHGYDQLSLS